jgi:hypothetical protein
MPREKVTRSQQCHTCDLLRRSGGAQAVATKAARQASVRAAINKCSGGNLALQPASRHTPVRRVAGPDDSPLKTIEAKEMPRPVADGNAESTPQAERQEWR